MADTILGNANSTRVLPIGNTQTGTIDFAGDADWWKVTLNAGFGYQVWVEGLASGAGTLTDPYLGIYNSLVRAARISLTDFAIQSDRVVASFTSATGK